MYNKGYGSDIDTGYTNDQTNTHDYYRNDVPVGSDAHSAGKGGANIEEMLFYSGSASRGADYSASGRNSSQAAQPSEKKRTYTVYEESDGQAEKDYRAYSHEDYGQAEAARRAPSREEGGQVETEYDEDAMPSQTTLQFLGRGSDMMDDYRDDGEGRSRNSFHITARGKLLIAVYAVAIAIILILIVLNTRLLKNMNSQIDFQQSKINAILEENRALETRLDYLMSDEVIEKTAEDELGMVHD